ncbi:histidine phosphatase family protein [Rufibacter sp. LB8]|uniref:histidine phosphatase family protein n=1 Tax=Rufibacter sp. LB8 TaxID=2777781 RepID=UPI00178C4256|nr:histidine phosphatase family protein [Rufibacter sp. LB8]
MAETAHIYLIRHARPLVERSGFFSKAAAQQYLQEYQVAEVEEILERQEGLLPHEINRVFCSPLPRAKATARMLFGPDVELVEDAAFREFESRIAGLPIGKFPLAWWQVTSRMLWMLGLNQREIESFRDARARATQVAQRLALEAEVQGLAVLVAHGFLNTFIKRTLRRQGWKVLSDNGRQFLGITQLEKKR